MNVDLQLVVRSVRVVLGSGLDLGITARYALYSIGHYGDTRSTNASVECHALLVGGITDNRSVFKDPSDIS